MVGKIRKLRQKARKTSTGRVLRGLFGPSKRIVKKTKKGLIKSGRTGLKTDMKTGKTHLAVSNKQAKKTSMRMAVKYALDLINIKSPEKRKRIMELTRSFFGRNEIIEGFAIPEKEKNKRHKQAELDWAGYLVKELGPGKAVLFMAKFDLRQKEIELTLGKPVKKKN